MTGKIALAKYGGPFRGIKILNAEAHGMVGVVMFSDPGDDGPQEAKGQATYPSMIPITHKPSYMHIAYAAQMARRDNRLLFNEDLLPTSTSTLATRQLPDIHRSPVSSVLPTHQICPRSRLCPFPTGTHCPF
jgi:hypothetical protein